MNNPFLWISILLLSILAGCKNDPPPLVPVPVPVPPAVDSVEISDIPDPYFLKTFAGKLDGQPMEMVLINWGDGFLSGRYRSPHHSQWLELGRELRADRSYEIAVFKKNKEVGLLRGVLTDSAKLSGIWQERAKNRQLAFELSEVIPTPDSIGWNGNWHLNQIWDKGFLMIGNVSNDSFDFALSVVRGSHTGALEGRARRIGASTAVFNKKEYEEQPCILKFERKDDHVTLEQTSSNFACGFGARAYAGGRYERQNLVRNAALEVGSGEAAVFATQAQHDAFKTLTGETYKLFAFNMQQTEKRRTPAGETVVSGFVPGLLRTHEAIIVYNGQGNIWAATLDVEQNKDVPLIRYYTNDPAFAKKLPPAVEEWREDIKNYNILFEK